MVDKRPIIFDDMNHLESFLEPFFNARWDSLSDDEKNLIKRTIMDNHNVVGNVEAKKEGKHLVDNRQIIFDDMNHLASFLDRIWKVRWGSLSSDEKYSFVCGINFPPDCKYVSIEE